MADLPLLPFAAFLEWGPSAVSCGGMSTLVDPIAERSSRQTTLNLLNLAPTLDVKFNS